MAKLSNKTYNIVGIDPGWAGGLSIISVTTPLYRIETKLCHCYPMPETEHEIAMLWKNVILPFEPEYAVIENVHAMPGQGVVSMFSFGRNVGFLQALIAYTGLSHYKVAPQRWQTALNCRTKGDKSVTRSAAQRLFPNLNVTNKTADALLIGTYGARNPNG